MYMISCLHHYYHKALQRFASLFPNIPQAGQCATQEPPPATPPTPKITLPSNGFISTRVLPTWRETKYCFAASTIERVVGDFFVLEKQNPQGYLYALLSGSSVRFAAGKDLYTHFIFLLCDWFSSAVFVVLGTCIAVQLGTNPDWMFFCCFAGTFMFYCAHWQTYVSGTLRFGM